MKKSHTLNIRLLLLVVLTLALYTTILINTDSATDVDCCEPPTYPPAVPRFPQNATVNIYVDGSGPGGFTETERQKIEQGLEDWNGRNNSSGLTFNVNLTATPPPPGTANTILVHFNPTVSQTAVATLNVHLNSGNVVWMEMTFNGNIRNGNPALAPEYVREVARHEGGHAHGIDEGNNCAPGSTIMRLGLFSGVAAPITRCDDSAINSDPAYATPASTPTPEFQLDCGPYAIPDYQNGICFYVGDTSPILIDITGDGFDLTDTAGGINFDIDADGIAERISWTTYNCDDVWLSLDRNANGIIDNGAELFGNYTLQPQPPAGESRNGFLALAEFDKPENGGNGDSRISSLDAVFPSLRLWQDADHNGISEPTELHTLLSRGIATLELEYKSSPKTDRYGNQFRYRAKVENTKGAQLGRWAWDVFLVRAP